MLKSQICKEQDFHTAWFTDACTKLKEPFKYHRKLWEWCYIHQTLLERGMLEPGKTGLGFGVGKEPLTSVFASYGCSVMATDLDFELAKSQGWVDTNQHALNVAALNERQICDPKLFEQLVQFENVDMNHIHPKLHGVFDFTWSSCSFEHVGSIELGKQFILNQMNCLRSGGIAVHTTEYNLSSNDDTINSGIYVIFRKSDIEWMVDALRAQGHHVEIDYSVGTGEIESFIDLPPYSHDPHLRLQLESYVSTSIGLIIQKA